MRSTQECMDLTEIVHFDHSERHPWELARQAVIEENLGQLIHQSGKDRDAITVLDIGCGDAYLVAQLSRKFPEIQFVGVDINFTDDQLEQLKEYYKDLNLKIYRNLEDVELNGNAVDVVLLLDVIEHIEDEISFMESLPSFDYIQDDTKYLITVPAFQNLFAAHDVILGHYRRYSNRSLRERLARAGFKTSFERYFFTTLIPPRFLQVIKEKFIKRDVSTGSDLAAWKGGKAVTQMIKGVLWTDYKIGSAFRSMGIKIPGLSNMVVCQRSS